MSDALPGDDSRIVTRILRDVCAGSASAASELLPLVYAELHELAGLRIASLGPGQTLAASDLVHEAYLRLIGRADPGWKGQAHFFGAAARAMRNVLADRQKRRYRLKRGGHCRRVGDDTAAELCSTGPSDDAAAIGEAIEALERAYPRSAEVVTLMFYGGLGAPEVAEALGLSSRTVEREWRFAKAWLNGRLAELEPET
jgi:RNA polymerase sigma factor (TIGR02999 family)